MHSLSACTCCCCCVFACCKPCWWWACICICSQATTPSLNEKAAIYMQMSKVWNGSENDRSIGRKRQIFETSLNPNLTLELWEWSNENGSNPLWASHTKGPILCIRIPHEEKTDSTIQKQYITRWIKYWTSQGKEHTSTHIHTRDTPTEIRSDQTKD